MYREIKEETQAYKTVAMGSVATANAESVGFGPTSRKVRVSYLSETVFKQSRKRTGEHV